MSFLYLPGAYEIIPLVISAAIMRLDSEDDRQFMASLYLTYRKQLVSYAFHLSHHKADAEDAVQNAFLSLISKVSLLRDMEETRLKGYVFTTVRNAVYLLKRKEQKMKAMEAEEAREAADPGDGIALFQYSAESLMTAIRQLCERDQTLLMMKYYQDDSDSEIAARFQVSRSSVRVMLLRARHRLKKLLDEGGQRND